MSLHEVDLRLPDGRTLHGYHEVDDDGPDGRATARPVLWQHGTPGTGEPPVPLTAVSGELGLRWFSFDRPGYGGSSPRPDRSPADVAADAAALADHLGVGTFAVAGHSGGASHALAVAAALPDRVDGVLAVAALAPRALFAGDGERSDDAWFAGMGPAATATLRAALAGRAAKEAHEAAGGGDDGGGDDGGGDIDFTAADWAVLEGEWGWSGQVAASGQASGPGPVVDDDLAHVGDWGVDLGAVRAPVVLLHGEDDRIAPVAHARRLAEVLPHADLRVVAGAGHLSVLVGAAAALRALHGLLPPA